VLNANIHFLLNPNLCPQTPGIDLKISQVWESLIEIWHVAGYTVTLRLKVIKSWWNWRGSP